MVLGKLPVPEHHTNLNYSKARACGWGLFGHFFLVFFFFSTFFLLSLLKGL